MSENQNPDNPKTHGSAADKAAAGDPSAHNPGALNQNVHDARDLAARDLAARAKAAGVPADASPEEIEAALAANESEAVDELTVALAEVATLKAKVADLQDQYVRGQAEVQNARRRAEDDVSKARKFGVESFAESLLPVTDSLVAGLAIKDATIEQIREGEAIKSMREGMEATLRQLTSALERNKVIAIDPPAGEKFDAHKHQAISMVPSEQEANTVVAVLQKGYTIAERVLRPALVTVAAAK
jgi:molecular chaperone GrpE